MNHKILKEICKMKKLNNLIVLLYFITIHCNTTGQIKRLWLTHQTNEPSHIVINWYSENSGSSIVYFRNNNGREEKIVVDENTKLHHVEVPLIKKDVIYNYRVRTGKEKSDTYSFKGYPSYPEQLRVAIVGNWGYSDKPDFSQLIKDDPHLLVTLGDNVPNLHEQCGEGVKDCVVPFLKLIDSAPGLFQTIPFMPILGNHDKEIRERGQKYPSLSVYDVNATAFLKFFELPDNEWKWRFTIPDFNVSFIALDLNHISDFATTWQTCHDFHYGSEQFEWYKNIMGKDSIKYKITLQNERNQNIRNQENGEWKRMFQKGSAVISGYGYYSERANVNGFPYFNTSLKAGDKYPDEYSKFLQVVGGYILISSENESIKIELKSLEGEVIDQFILN